MLRVRDLRIGDGGRRHFAQRVGELAALANRDDGVVLAVQDEKRWGIGV